MPTATPAALTTAAVGAAPLPELAVAFADPLDPLDSLTP